MTSNAELIAEARQRARMFGEATAIGSLIDELADALEAGATEAVGVTADAAGVTGRERLARTLFVVRQQAGDWETGSDAMRRHWLEYADAILAAGFGDVAEAKAEALEDAADRLERDGTNSGDWFYESWLRARAAERRAPGVNGGGE